jgi:hypothetical protein
LFFSPFFFSLVEANKNNAYDGFSKVQEYRYERNGIMQYVIWHVEHERIVLELELESSLFDNKKDFYLSLLSPILDKNNDILVYNY